jgi:adenine-specific DNA-methyltransferase
MPIEKLRPSFTFTEDRLKELQAVVPEAFADGKINWDTLREALGENLKEENQEHFGLFWPGKREARRLAAMPSIGTLIPQPGEGVNEDTTHNIFIEGDNLEVLKLLQKSYAGRIKMIYIDPPYNTGNDFIYVDDFSEPLEAYLQRTELMNEAGQLLTSNPRASGRFHSNWLNMMYPRLLLARQLLRDDGVIFISIDDNELTNLKVVMDEIFGEENFINVVSVKAKPSAGASGGGEDKRLKKNVEFLLIYSKNRESEDETIRFRDVYEEADLFEHIQTMKDEDKSWKYTRALINTGEKKLAKTILDGSGNEIRIYRHVGFGLVSISSLISDEMKKNNSDPVETEHLVYHKYFSQILRDTNAQSSIRTRVMEALGDEDGLFSIEYIPKSGKNKGKVTTVYYKGTKKDQIAWLSDIAYDDNGRLIIKGKISTLWDDFNWNNVSKEGGISFPNGKKPIAFIQRMLELATTGEDKELVLDFFAGSGSSAHAVLDLNAKDNGDRYFIIVQLPEKMRDDNQFKNIAELCKQRIRNSINESESLLQSQMGFISYQLNHSNFKKWQSYDGQDTLQLEGLFARFESPLIVNWQPNNLLNEILLSQGFPLDSSIRPLPEYSHNQIKELTSNFCQHRLYVCLDEKFEPETVAAIHLHLEDVFVCLDIALTDEEKVQLADRCNLMVI